MRSFEDHQLWHPDCNTNNIYITSKQDLIISYCTSKDRISTQGEIPFCERFVFARIFFRDCALLRVRVAPFQSMPEPKYPHPAGTVNISSIFTGKCLAKIAPTGFVDQSSKRNKALSGICAVFYNEDHNEVYTGNEQGHLHIWGACPTETKEAEEQQKEAAFALASARHAAEIKQREQRLLLEQCEKRMREQTAKARRSKKKSKTPASAKRRAEQARKRKLSAHPAHSADDQS